MMRLNLIPPEERVRPRNEVDIKRIMVPISAVFLMGLIGLGISIQAQLSASRERFVAQSQLTETLQTQRRDVESIEADLKQLQDTVSAFQQVLNDSGDSSLIGVMERLASYTDTETIWLTRFELYRQGEVLLTGTAASYDAISALMYSLESDPMFERVAVETIGRPKENAGSRLEFTIKGAISKGES